MKMNISHNYTCLRHGQLSALMNIIENYLWSQVACSPIVTLPLTQATFGVGSSLIWTWLQLFLRCPSARHMHGIQDISEFFTINFRHLWQHCPYMFPSFAPAFGMITAASYSRTGLIRSYPSVEWDATKTAARLRLRSSRYLSRVGE